MNKLFLSITSILILGLAFGVFLVYNPFVKPIDTVIWYQGKGYKLYSLVGEGKTRQNRVPVYKPVFVPLDQADKAK